MPKSDNLSKEAKEILQDLSDIASDMLFKAYDDMTVDSKLKAGNVVSKTEKELRK